MKKFVVMLGAGALMAAGVAVPAVAQGGGQGHQAGGTSSASCNDGTVTASPAILWPPNHKMHDISLTYSEHDGDGDTLQITGVDETMMDVNGKVGANGQSLGSGGPQHDPDYVGPTSFTDGADGGSPASTAVQIRSERSGTTGNGSGRVYSLTVHCKDSGGTDPTEATGESDTGTVFVCVPHDMSDASRTFCDKQINS